MSRFVVSLLLVTSLAGSAFAQTPPLAQQRLFSPSAYLERVAWTAQERGPLLVVAPNIPFQIINGTRAPNLSALPREGGVNVLEFATALQRRLVRNGALSALVPEKMFALNTKLGKPDLSQLPQSEAVLALVSSLDERQWRLLCGPTGIGQRDLTPQQAPFLARVLPVSLVAGQPGRPDSITVPAEALAQGRLHLGKQAQFFFAYQDDKLNAGGGGGFSGRVSGADTRPTLSRDFRAQVQRQSGDYGVPMTLELPNRLKPSQLDYKSPSLSSLVTLDGAQTLGELIARAAKATGLEISADKRLAELPVWTRAEPGQSVRAGDLLEALALSVTGAFRKLEAPKEKPLWLLTDDIEGLATRRERQRLWQEETQKLVQELRQGYDERLRAIKPARFIGFDNTYGFSSAVVGKLDKLTMFTGIAVPLSELPTSVSDQLTATLRKEIDAQQSGRSRSTINGVENPPLDPSRIKLSVRDAALSFDVPGYGVYHDDSVGFLLSATLRASERSTTPRPNQLPPPPPRPELRSRIAIFRPQSAAEARQVVAEASAAKLSALWIATDGVALEALKAGLAEGKKANLPVGALVNLAQLPESAPADLDILGQPGPWRVPDASETAAALLPRLRTLAMLPDLAGLALAGTAAPGYEVGTLSEIGRQASLGFGYTPERRLRFVRTDGIDPLDITTDGSSGFLQSRMRIGQTNTTPPVDPTGRWSKVRFEANKALLTQTYTTLKDAAPNLPLWIEGRQASPLLNSWFGSWEKAEALPTYQFSPFGGNEIEDDLQQARKYSKQVLYANSYPDKRVFRPGARTGISLETWLTEILYNEAARTKTFPWDGAILDLQALPIEKAIAVLKETKL